MMSRQMRNYNINIAYGVISDLVQIFPCRPRPEQAILAIISEYMNISSRLSDHIN